MQISLLLRSHSLTVQVCTVVVQSSNI